MLNGVSKPKPGWLTRVTEEASYGHWVSSSHLRNRSLARMYSCTQGYFSKHVHIFYLILSVTNINDKSQGGNTGFLTFSPMFCAVYAAVAFYLCL